MITKLKIYTYIFGTKVGTQSKEALVHNYSSVALLEFYAHATL